MIDKFPMGLFLALWLLFIASLLPAQTAVDLERLLDSPAVTFSQAAYFVLGSAGITDSFGNDVTGNSVKKDDLVKTPFDLAMANSWLPKKARPDDPLTLGNLSFLMTRVFGIKGGLMYRLFPGKRYAYRTMVSRSFIQGRSDPAMKVDGQRFLLILGNVLNTRGGEE